MQSRVSSGAPYRSRVRLRKGSLNPDAVPSEESVGDGKRQGSPRIPSGWQCIDPGLTALDSPIEHPLQVHGRPSWSSDSLVGKWEDRCHLAPCPARQIRHTSWRTPSRSNRGQADIGVRTRNLTLEVRVRTGHRGRHWADRGCGGWAGTVCPVRIRRRGSRAFPAFRHQLQDIGSQGITGDDDSGREFLEEFSAPWDPNCPRNPRRFRARGSRDPVLSHRGQDIHTQLWAARQVSSPQANSNGSPHCQR